MTAFGVVKRDISHACQSFIADYRLLGTVDRPLADQPSWLFTKRPVVLLVAAIVSRAPLFAFYYD